MSELGKEPKNYIEKKSEQEIGLFDSLSPEDIVDILHSFWQEIPELAEMLSEEPSDTEIKMAIREEIMRESTDLDLPIAEAAPQFLMTLAALNNIEDRIIEEIKKKNLNIESIE